MSSPTPFLLTGVTGGLGSKILHEMLHTHHVPPQDIIATSRSPSKRSHYECQNLQFRIADYKDPSSLLSAFSNVRDLLFMSSSERDTATRTTEHRNVIEAAKKTGVRKVWYVSLAFGGWGDSSKIGFQQAHYETENLLKESGLEFVSLRAGLYSDAFPLFLNWYPESKEVLFPKVEPTVEDSRIAFTSRDELGEGIATLLVRRVVEPKGEKRIVLLTASETNSLVDLVEAIDSELPVRYLYPEDWIEESAKDDIGGKDKAWFEARLVFTEGVCKGDAAVMDPALEKLLGRKPETGVQAVRRLIQEAGEKGYRWHQNHMKGKGM